MMTLRQRLLDASKKAKEVHRDAASETRIAQGFSRINPLQLAEEAGVAVMSIPLDKLLGAFLRESRAGILLNSERPVGMMHMTCAHELGHYFLGHLTTADEHIDYGDTDSTPEQEANQFAYSLMAPRWLVLRAVAAKGWGKPDLLKPPVVYQLSLRLGISFKAMAWALARLKIITNQDANRIAAAQPKSLKEAVLPAQVMLERNADVWVLDSRDKDWVIEPRSTDRFLVDLPSHASAGYLWSTEELESEGFTLSPVLVDARERKRPEQPLVGGSGQDRYLLSAPTGAGRLPAEAQIQFREAQPWQAQDDVDSDLALKMQFESIEKGLSDGTRQREIQAQ
jgi:Zn-dependent peptidase ImmA (M78 family)